MTHRLERLRKRLGEEGLDAILISQGENRRYLSGFTGSAGFILISQQSAILATDFRYVEQAKSQAPSIAPLALVCLLAAKPSRQRLPSAT